MPVRSPSHPFTSSALSNLVLLDPGQAAPAYILTNNPQQAAPGNPAASPGLYTLRPGQPPASPAQYPGQQGGTRQ